MESLVGGCLDCDERERVRNALLAYCSLDTLAMVRLRENLRSILVSNRRVQGKRSTFGIPKESRRS